MIKFEIKAVLAIKLRLLNFKSPTSRKFPVALTGEVLSICEWLRHHGDCKAQTAAKNDTEPVETSSGMYGAEYFTLKYDRKAKQLYDKDGGIRVTLGVDTHSHTVHTIKLRRNLPSKQ